MKLFNNINLSRLKDGLSKTRDKLVNRITETFSGKAVIDDNTLDDLEEMLVQRCRYLIDNIGIVKSSTFFHWWPESKSD